MKRAIFAVMMAMVVAIAVPVFAADEDPWIGVFDSSLVIEIEDKGNMVQVTVNTPRTNNGGPVTKIIVGSGILHAANRNHRFAEVEVENDKATFRMPNLGRRELLPVVEHLWLNGIDLEEKEVWVVLSPEDPWVVYKTKKWGGHKLSSGERVDPNTLAIGIVMYPNAPTVPLKSLGKGKLKQGRHPELAIVPQKE